MVTGHAGTPRSYVVQRLARGVPLRRNRLHLRPTSGMFPDAIQTMDDDDEEEEVVHTPTNDVGNDVAVAPSSNAGAEAVLPPTVDPLRRSTRTRKQTEFFQSG